MAPETRYARTPDGLSIAYQTVGEGPVDLLYVLGFMGNLEVIWEQSVLASFFTKLEAFSRLIVFDRRATGLSDRATSLPPLEVQVDDMWTVLDAAGSSSTAIFGVGWGCFSASLFAGTHPNRVRALILWEPSARGAWAEDYPSGFSDPEIAHDLSSVGSAWGTEAYAASLIASEAPTRAADRDFIRWAAKVARHWVAPSSAVGFTKHFYDSDVRHVLPTLRVPTLVLTREDTEEVEYVASLIPGAELVRLEGVDTIPSVGDQDSVVEAVRAFLGVERLPEDDDTALQTVLFTDIVGSTERLAELGDVAWSRLAEDHHLAVRAQLARFRGVEVDTAGDGFFAVFDGPARAVRCAVAIVDSVRELGIEIRWAAHG